KTDRDGFNTTFEYDMLNNLSRIKYSDKKQVNFEYDDLNHMISMKDWLGENSFELDSLGRIKKLKDYKDRILQYGWNGANEREYVIYPDGERVDYKYDELGRIVEVSGMDETSKYDYDILGRIKKQILPGNINIDYSYTSINKLKGMQSVNGNETIDKREFAYDKVGNRISSIINGEKFQCKYDNMNQLIEEVKDNNNIIKYFYDTVGNRFRVEDWMEQNTTDITEYNYDNNEHLINISGKRTNLLGNNEFLHHGIDFQYDKRGNLMKAYSGDNILAELEFDETNKLSNFISNDGKNKNFVYDGFNIRIKVDNSDAA
ncbi:MAG: hypothetical protein ABF289_02285, partial [Clostridiales bacterium]